MVPQSIRLSAYAADIVQLMNDDIDLAQLIAGTYSREDVAGNKSGDRDIQKLAQLGLVESRVSEQKLVQLLNGYVIECIADPPASSRHF